MSPCRRMATPQRGQGDAARVFSSAPSRCPGKRQAGISRWRSRRRWRAGSEASAWALRAQVQASCNAFPTRPGACRTRSSSATGVASSWTARSGARAGGQTLCRWAPRSGCLLPPTAAGTSTSSSTARWSSPQRVPSWTTRLAPGSCTPSWMSSRPRWRSLCSPPPRRRRSPGTGQPLRSHPQARRWAPWPAPCCLPRCWAPRGGDLDGPISPAYSAARRPKGPCHRISPAPRPGRAARVRPADLAFNAIRANCVPHFRC
mmetsp:Transcript_63641/g.163817  ORF Transcript_63641/g.163817 Transcript_63641/m.163817 type:complete len:260 (-) Transcript_63641:105-884(-)